MLVKLMEEVLITKDKHNSLLLSCLKQRIFCFTAFAIEANERKTEQWCVTH
jgi:hypothetical protein